LIEEIADKLEKIQTNLVKCRQVRGNTDEFGEMQTSRRKYRQV